MADRDDSAGRDGASEGEDGSGVRETLESWFVTGAVLFIPLVVTLIVLQFALDFVSSVLVPVVRVVNYVLPFPVPNPVIELGSVLAFLLVLLVTGAIARGTADHVSKEWFDGLVESIPLLGSVYRGFRQMSEILLADDSDSFEEVKLIEVPHEETFRLGFLTAETPPEIEQAAGHEEMCTVFLPNPPNPSGGSLLFVPTDRVLDVDMTVEEGLQTIVTTGVATAPEE